jgi:ribosome biogenesis GTPase
LHSYEVTSEAHESALERLGWDSQFAADFEPHRQDGYMPGRVAVEHKSAFVVYGGMGVLSAQPSGRFRHEAAPEELPSVGDWVAVSDAGPGRGVIHAVLPRRTKFSRKMAGFETTEQILAANIDIAFLVSALMDDLNLRRIERYLTTAWASGATPVVLLTKADLFENTSESLAAVEQAAPGTSVHLVSGVTGLGLDEIRAHLRPNRTATMLGSSGVGKSTLINALMGKEYFATAGVRWDGRGRHTTTHRELVLVPGGGLIIDTPGLRELQLWDTSEGLDETFQDIEALARECKFNDCLHEREPGCAVRTAVADGRLTEARFSSYKKLEREYAHLETKRNARARAEQKRRHRKLTKAYRAQTKVIKTRGRG